ncbi:MAG: hypothetical protein MUO63_17490 [Desulfobulbaceae bacterium]|nr:hypothetical protein [Desulfobulbaceae bacterium]
MDQVLYRPVGLAVGEHTLRIATLTDELRVFPAGLPEIHVYRPQQFPSKQTKRMKLFMNHLMTAGVS